MSSNDRYTQNRNEYVMKGSVGMIWKNENENENENETTQRKEFTSLEGSSSASHRSS